MKLKFSGNTSLIEINRWLLRNKQILAPLQQYPGFSPSSTSCTTLLQAISSIAQKIYFTFLLGFVDKALFRSKCVKIQQILGFIKKVCLQKSIVVGYVNDCQCNSIIKDQESTGPLQLFLILHIYRLLWVTFFCKHFGQPRFLGFWMLFFV